MAYRSIVNVIRYAIQKLENHDRLLFSLYDTIH